MQESQHARRVAERFRELLQEEGTRLSDTHCEELALLVEAAIDAALVDRLERIADALEAQAREIRHQAESAGPGESSPAR